MTGAGAANVRGRQGSYGRRQARSEPTNPGVRASVEHGVSLGVTIVLVAKRPW